MQQRRLGRTGLKVSEVCLGTMTFGVQCDEPLSRAILDRAAEGGVTFLDTADCYPIPLEPQTVGRTEEILGRWLQGRRERFVLASKCFFPMGPGPNDRGNSRRHVLAAAEASLRRLQTDFIDLYQVHAFDPETPLDETLRALDDLVRAGKVRYAGCSNFRAWELARALAVSERRGVARFDSTHVGVGVSWTAASWLWRQGAAVQRGCVVTPLIRHVAGRRRHHDYRESQCGRVQWVQDLFGENGDSWR